MLKIMSVNPAFRSSKMVQISDGKKSGPAIFVNPDQVLMIKNSEQPGSKTNIFLAAPIDNFSGNLVSVEESPAVVANKLNAEA